MQTILYCHRESGHSYKVALALTLIGRAVRAAPGRSQSSARAAPRGFPPRIDVRRSARADRRGRPCGLPVERDPRSPRAPLTQLDGATPAAQTRVREWLAWEANRIAMSLPHLRFSRRFTPAGEALEAYWTGRMHADLDRLDRALRDERFPRRRRADDRRHLVLRLSVLGRPGRGRSRAVARGRRMARAHPFAAALAGAV